MSATLAGITFNSWAGAFTQGSARTASVEGPNGTTLVVLPEGAPASQITFTGLFATPPSLDSVVGTVVAVVCPGGFSGNQYLESAQVSAMPVLSAGAWTYQVTASCVLRRVPA